VVNGRGWPVAIKAAGLAIDVIQSTLAIGGHKFSAFCPV